MGLLNTLLSLTLEVPRPPRKPRLGERFLWTALVLFAYLAMAQVPLYGIQWGRGEYERMLLIQVIMASHRGTLMELGIGPLVTAGIVWQMLVGGGLIKLDLTTREGRKIYSGVQKLLTLAFALAQSLAYIWGGYYGLLSLPAQLLVVTQLMFASLLVLLMDDMLEKGWGVGSAVSLFIAAGVALQVFWELFSPLAVGDGLFIGVVPSLLHATFTYATTGNATLLHEAVIRGAGYPSFVGLVSMIGFVLLLTYLDSVRVEIPISAARYGGVRSKLPLKLLYVSNLPVILISTVYANLFIVARAMWTRFNPGNINPWFNIFAMYNATTMEPLKPSLVYYLTPPMGLASLARDPVQVAVYVALFVALSIAFSWIWVSATGMDPRGQAEQFAKAELQIPGFRSSTSVLEAVLRPYVWSLTAVSGALVGFIAALGDLLGTLGSGTGLMLLVGILTQYQQLLARERLLEAHPAISRLLGTEG